MNINKNKKKEKGWSKNGNFAYVLDAMIKSCNNNTTAMLGSEADAVWCPFAIHWDEDEANPLILTPQTLAEKMGAHPKLIESIHSFRHVGFGRGHDVYNASIKGRGVAFTKQALDFVPDHLRPSLEEAVVAAGGIYRGSDVSADDVSVLVVVFNLDNDEDEQREQMVRFHKSLNSQLFNLYSEMYCPPPPNDVVSTPRKMVLTLDEFFVNVNLPEEFLINIGEAKCDNPPKSLVGLDILIESQSNTFDKEKLERIAERCGGNVIKWDFSKGKDQWTSWDATKTVVVSTCDYHKLDLDSILSAKKGGVRFITLWQFLDIAQSCLGEMPSREEYLIEQNEEDDVDNEFTSKLNEELLNKRNGIAFSMAQNLMNPYPVFCVAQDTNENVVYGFICGLVST